MKVAVYTIALNEAAHAERWASSATDADYRIVADTGSTDGTVEKLRAAGVRVHQIAIKPWRFDDARNAALALIPADVDVCCTMDMDMFLQPGWRPRLEAAWRADTTALYCRMALRSRAEDPKPFKIYPSKSFHSRWGYRFKRAAHEALFYCGDEVAIGCDEISIHHLRGNESNHDQYLKLMEIAYSEDPQDTQICFWLGREHMWRGDRDRAIDLMKIYLSLPGSKWGEERSEAMRFLAKMEEDQTDRLA